jgi:hypothetical protein
MKKLYCVTYETKIMVLADSAHDAEEEVRDDPQGCGVCEDDDDTFLHATEVTEIAQCPEQWRGCIPYGPADDEEIDKTCSQILKERAT